MKGIIDLVVKHLCRYIPWLMTAEREKGFHPWPGSLFLNAVEEVAEHHIISHTPFG